MTDEARTKVPEPAAVARREARLRLETAAELVLLRHGEPDWTPHGGPSVDDAELTARGRLQAQAAATALAAEHSLQAIYVSPLRRARQTAEPLGSATGIEPVVVAGLAEIHVPLGGYSQTQVEDYFKRASERRLRDHWHGWPGGESFRDFHGRVTATLDELLSRHGMPIASEDEFRIWKLPERPQRIAIVAHGGTNAVALTHMLGIEPVPWEWSRFESELAAYSVSHARTLGRAGFIWSLQNFNEVQHLRDARLR